MRASTSTKRNDSCRIDSRPRNRISTCRYFPLLNTSVSFISKGDNLTYKSKINVNCQKSNCIYLITCSYCGTQYVGQTKNKLLTRFNSHFGDIHHNHDTTVGPLIGAPQCRLSILRNGNVPCRYFRNVPVNFKIALCRLSILRNGNVPCR